MQYRPTLSKPAWYIRRREVSPVQSGVSGRLCDRSAEPISGRRLFPDRSARSEPRLDESEPELLFLDAYLKRHTSARTLSAARAVSGVFSERARLFCVWLFGLECD